MPSNSGFKKTSSGVQQSRTLGVRKSARNMRSSPIVKLDEIAKKKGKSCVYQLIQSHANMKFNIRCTVGENSGVGEGGSENAAKLASAKALITNMSSRLTGADDGDAIDMSTDVHPIDQLAQAAAQQGWTAPTYQVQHDEQQFVVVCQLQQWKEEGTGLTKESAEFIAASKMLEFLSSL